MYDCSTALCEENLKNLAAMVKIARSRNVTVEGELRHVGDNEGEGKLSRPEDTFTDPAKAAALAIAVGNAHGDYRFLPKLDFDRIKEIRRIVPVPLVLHGGSGLPDDDFRKAVLCGI